MAEQRSKLLRRTTKKGIYEVTVFWVEVWNNEDRAREIKDEEDYITNNIKFFNTISDYNDFTIRF